MAAIRSGDTKPELVVRKGLHRLGFRYRLQDTRLPGRPDLYLPKYRAVIFVHGCFWHGHDCPLFRLPATRTDFWREKLKANVERDRRNTERLYDDGYRLAVVWECALKGKDCPGPEAVIGALSAWLRSPQEDLCLAGDCAGEGTSSQLD